MKKVVLTLLLSILLSACGTPPEQTVRETPPREQIPPRQVLLTLPEEAAAPVTGEAGRQLYLCDGYELQVQTADSLEEALRQVTGLPEDRLTVMKRGEDRCETVWCSTGEGREQIGRAVIREADGWYYCVCMLADAERAEELEPVWKKITESIALF